MSDSLDTSSYYAMLFCLWLRSSDKDFKPRNKWHDVNNGATHFVFTDPKFGGEYLVRIKRSKTNAYHS